MKYVFDTNVFANLIRLYPRDIFPSLWAMFENLSKESFIVPNEVIDELNMGKDDLVLWLKEYAFIMTLSDYSSSFQSVIDAEPRYLNSVSEADVYVLAAAHRLQFSSMVTIVTNESSRPQAKLPRFPMLPKR